MRQRPTAATAHEFCRRLAVRSRMSSVPVAVAVAVAGLGLGLGLGLAPTSVAHAEPAPLAPIAVTSASAPLTHHIERRAYDMRACAQGERRAVITVKVTARWDRDGKTRAIVVRGGSARFNRCVTSLLGGWVADVAGRGSASARLEVHRLAPPPPTVVPPPTPDPHDPLGRWTTPMPPGLDACATTADCTIYFRTLACVPSDPIAVAAGQLDLARATYPHRIEACGMGGPQYEALRRSNATRYSTTCEARRCVLHDHAADGRPAIGP